MSVSALGRSAAEARIHRRHARSRDARRKWRVITSGQPPRTGTTAQRAYESLLCRAAMANSVNTPASRRARSYAALRCGHTGGARRTNNHSERGRARRTHSPSRERPHEAAMHAANGESSHPASRRARSYAAPDAAIPAALSQRTTAHERGRVARILLPSRMKPRCTPQMASHPAKRRAKRAPASNRP